MISHMLSYLKRKLFPKAIGDDFGKSLEAEVGKAKADEIVMWFSFQLENNLLERPECIASDNHGGRFNVSPFFSIEKYTKKEIEKAFYIYMVSVPDPIAAYFAKVMYENDVSRIVPDWLGDPTDAKKYNYYYAVSAKEVERISKDVAKAIQERKKLYGDDLEAVESMTMAEIQAKKINTHS